ncbi:hypothetical protein IGI04_035472 [Brassica rapa subsp. trilocularis]|uniref:Uncharacterized protein n=1 Tax=Brassica rapa subsp. trilocularis TaxID=1813537 RepID=A0ABQ7LBQ8_BRACM|nr:hypothetical protein IGI04_035472 [Brassica rapa subsp. trilocularis]
MSICWRAHQLIHPDDVETELEFPYRAADLSPSSCRLGDETSNRNSVIKPSINQVGERSAIKSRSSSTVQVSLLRFWDARNLSRGGDLMGVDMLLLDSQEQ